jgi:FAD-dependent urate hydroxylase
MDVAALWAGVGESRALSRADLQQVLLTGVGGEVRYDTAVKALEVFDRTAKVEFGDGSVAEYDLVIGADGRRSRIRAQAGLGGPAVATGQIVYRAVVSGGPPLSDWTALLGRRCAFVAMPMGSRKIYCYADETAPDSPGLVSPGSVSPGSDSHGPDSHGPDSHGPDSHGLDDPVARLRELFAGFAGPVPAILDAVEKVQVARTDEVVIDAWSRGPVLLVGDAAHATAPTLAQGAAMSFEDAVVLGEELRAHPEDVPAALRAYEERRRPRCSQVRDRTRERDRTRDMPPALRDPMLRRRGLGIFTEHYRGLLPPL